MFAHRMAHTEDREYMLPDIMPVIVIVSRSRCCRAYGESRRRVRRSLSSSSISELVLGCPACLDNVQCSTFEVGHREGLSESCVWY